MNKKILTDTVILSKLKKLKGWKRIGDEITKLFEFKDFVGAMGFVTKVAILSEKADHHPDIDIRWNKVTLTLSTHSEGGLTEKDFSLASEVEHLQ